MDRKYITRAHILSYAADPLPHLMDNYSRESVIRTLVI